MTEEAPDPKHKEGEIKVVRWLIGLPVGFFAILMLVSEINFALSPEKEEQWVERETIRQCWKEVERPEPSANPPPFSEPAQCQSLEFEFKQRWGSNP